MLGMNRWPHDFKTAPKKGARRSFGGNAFLSVPPAEFGKLEDVAREDLLVRQGIIREG